VLPYLCPPQLECAQLWIDEARILQDSSFTLVALVDRMWGLTNEEVAFARLRIYGPFTVDWIQRAIPDLRPTQMVLAQWIVEHNRLMMECSKPVVSGSHRMLQRLITPDILAGLLGLSASQRRRVGRRLRHMGMPGTRPDNILTLRPIDFGVRRCGWTDDGGGPSGRGGHMKGRSL
jgi:hypothetical protein